MARFYARKLVRITVGDSVIAPTSKEGDYFVIDTEDRKAIEAIRSAPGFGREVFDADDHDKASEKKAFNEQKDSIIAALKGDAALKKAVLGHFEK